LFETRLELIIELIIVHLSLWMYFTINPLRICFTHNNIFSIYIVYIYFSTLFVHYWQQYLQLVIFKTIKISYQVHISLLFLCYNFKQPLHICWLYIQFKPCSMPIKIYWTYKKYLTMCTSTTKVRDLKRMELKIRSLFQL
jgi:hypothetical protein